MEPQKSANNNPAESTASGVVHFHPDSCGAMGSFLVRRMGFTKLDEGILQSSVMAEDGDTFKIWVTLLAACKEDGVARISPVFIHSICHIDIDKVLKCLERLSSPDPLSRSTNDDGRRIERINGGYRIINYHKYRSFTYSGTKAAAKKRKQREKINDLNDKKGTKRGRVPKGGGHSASASASASASLKRGIHKGGKFIPPTIEQVVEYCRERRNNVNPYKWHSFYEAKGWMVGKNKMKDWRAAVRTWEDKDDIEGKEIVGFTAQGKEIYGYPKK